jgi:hypothetical protein
MAGGAKYKTDPIVSYRVGSEPRLIREECAFCFCFTEQRSILTRQSRVRGTDP